jgi:hemerythrin superfamily protein
MPDVTELLMRDHRNVENLFRDYESTEDAEVIEQICRELEIHTMVEEEVVYPRLTALDADLERRARTEHEQAKELISQIRAGDPDTTTLARQLQHAVQQHVEEEETTVFPLMERELDAELATMGELVQSRKQELLTGSS